MTYILYGDQGSGSAPVEMILAEISAPVELREVPLGSNAQLSPEHRRINPLGRIPALVLPDGTAVTESLAILLTIADRHPEAGLLPEPGSPARAALLRWMALAAGEAYPHVTRWDYPDRFSADPSHAPAIRERAQAMVREVWRIVEEHAGLRGTTAEPYLLGARFSLADPYLAVLPRWCGGRDWLPAACPRLATLARAVAARRAIAPIWARHFPRG
ncbi:MAG TPA: glutathione S-transferase family protein [Acetobacteraceae bacterium]|nr:glutathione S-transferase family protein [Acetobacteraceae bacterium]